MRSAVELGGATDTSTGLLTKLLASVRISSENVAENISVWRFAGNNLMIFLMS